MEYLLVRELLNSPFGGSDAIKNSVLLFAK